MRMFLYVLYVCVRACDLFNGAISGSEYRTSNGRVDNGNGVEGNLRGVLQSTLSAFAYCD